MIIFRVKQLLISALFILLLGANIAFAEERLVVAIDATYAPMSFVAPNDKPEGILVELWRLWSQQTGIEVEFVHGTWEHTLEMVKSGKADVHSGLFKNAQRAKWLSFSDALYSIKSAFYHRAKAENPALNEPQKTKIGVVAGTYQYDYLRTNFPNLDIVEYEDHNVLLTALVSSEIDVLFDEVPTISRGLARNGWQGLVVRMDSQERSNTVHAAALKERESLIRTINEGFRSLDSTSLSAIDERWTANPTDRFYKALNASARGALNKEELEFIQKHPSISLTSTPNWPPFEMKMSDGSYAGIAADFIRLAAQKVGLDIIPVFDTNWGAHMDKLKTGALDVAPGLNETPKRLEHFTFTKPYIEYYSAIFTKTDREDIAEPADLAGKTVALEDGYAIARALPNDNPEINILLVKTTQEALEAVSTGKADAYIGNQVVASYLIKKFTLPNLKLVSLWRTDLPGKLRFAVNKDNPVLKGILQKGLDAITKKEREGILSTYLDVSGFKQKIFSLSKEQWEWLKAHPRLVLGVDSQSAPFEFVDENGEYKGISSEYVRYIEDKLKIELDRAKGLNWGEVLQYAKERRIDVLTSVVRTPEREKFLLFTDPYITFPVVIYSAKEAPLIGGIGDVLKGRVAVVEGYATQEFLQTDYPALELLLYPTVQEAINALSMGEADWFINDLATGGYTIEQMGVTNLKVAASTDYSMSLSIAVRKDYPELVEILNKALNVVSDEEASEFKGKWLALKFEHGLDMRTVLIWALPISGGVLLVIGAIVLWNRKMGREIAERKKAQSELAETLGSLDEKNQMLEGLSSKLSKYLSPQVYDSIFMGNRDVALSTERKKLTVFFSDIKDFTQTTDDMQPEDLTALLNSYFTEMSAIALEYGATIDKFIGDAMLMFFGDPETKGIKEDAILCVRMAIAMQERMVSLEKEWHRMGYDKPFKMRVGINTGYCNVGNFGSEARMDYTIIGGEVNLAARLEGQADPGGLLVSSETYSLVQDIVTAEEREAISVKGIRRAIRPYAILGLRIENDKEDNKTISYSQNGIEIHVELEKLTPDERKSLSNRLSNIVKELDN